MTVTGQGQMLCSWYPVWYPLIVKNGDRMEIGEHGKRGSPVNSRIPSRLKKTSGDVVQLVRTLPTKSAPFKSIIYPPYRLTYWPFPKRMVPASCLAKNTPSKASIS